MRPARGDARPTALNSRRSELVTIFENYGLLVAGFDALRSDAYEKQIAAESPDRLEQVYEALLDPALGFAQARERCPVWPEGSRQAGKLPSMMTLREIKERILLEGKVRDRMKHGGFVERLQEVGLDDEQTMAAASMILGEELLSAKFNGTPISENLRVLDRMLRIAGLKLRQNKAKAEFGKRKAETNGEKSVQCSVSSVQQKHEADMAKGTARKPIIGNKQDECKTKSGLILETGYEPLNWLPALQKKDSLAEMILEKAKD